MAKPTPPPPTTTPAPSKRHSNKHHSKQLRSKYKRQKVNERRAFLDQEYHRISSRKKYFGDNDGGVHVHYFALHKHFHTSPIVQYLNLSAHHYLVLRQDSSMEVWDASGCIRRMTGRPHAMLRNVFFHKQHLITTGLDGFIRVWDLATFNIVHQFASHGGPIWDCLHIEDDKFLIACEDGKARQVELSTHPLAHKSSTLTWQCQMLSVFTPTLIHTPSPSSNNARIHCLAYLHNQRRILCGGRTGVYCFDLDSGLLNFHITSRGGMVWCLESLDNDQFALGDAEGHVSICEARYGTIVHQYKAHSEDVLSLCAFHPISTAGYKRELYSLASVGVDGQYVCYKQLTPCQWAFDSSLRSSLHDVLCISPHIQAFEEGTLLLGGVEGNITVLPPKLVGEPLHKMRLDTVGSNIISVAPDTGIIALHDNQQAVHIMYIPVHSEQQVRSARYINPSFDYAPSIVLQIKVESEAGWNISSLALSPNAQYLAITTPDLVELIELKHNREEHVCEIVSRVNLRHKGLIPGFNVRFATNGLLVLTDRQQKVQFFDLTSMEKVNKTIITGHDTMRELHRETSFFPESLDQAISMAFTHSIQCIAANNKYAVIAYAHHVDVYDVNSLLKSSKISTETIEPHWTIPFSHGLVCSVQVNGRDLHVMGSNFAYSHFELNTKTCSIERGSFPMRLDAQSHEEDSLCPHVNAPYRDPTGPIKFVTQLKKSKTYLMASSTYLYAYNPREHRISSAFIWNERIRHNILCMEALGKKQILVCVSPFTEQLYELPPVLYRKRVGAS